MNVCYTFYVVTLLFTMIVPATYSQEVKIILTANTADGENEKLFFPLVESYCGTQSQPVVLVLNGDLIDADDSLKIRQWQIRINQLLDRFTQLQIVVNQGDRDWDESGKDGWEHVKGLEKKLNENKHPRCHVFIEHGCPGPWTLSISKSLELVIVNSQWWNHPFDKPLPSSDACDIADTNIFTEELEEILDESYDKRVMILSHFPLESTGNYSGRFSAAAHLIAPIIGSMRVAFRQNVGTQKDISNEHFDVFRQRLESILKDYSSVVFASGHEQNQSIIKVSENYFINSGNLGPGSYSQQSKKEIFSSSSGGFIEITYKENGDVYYQFLRVNGNQLEGKASGQLIDSKKYPLEVPKAAQAITFGTTPIETTIHAVAGPEYKSNKFKQHWLGKHYRDSWTIPVRAPYLNMDTTHRGLLVKGKGGGRQTTSLKLSGGDSVEYVFRSVNKDPSKALDYELRGTIVADVLKDQTTTQQPYGALAVSTLLDKVGILHANPSLYVLPDDDRLGLFREKYKNLFGMLEERPTDKIEKDKIFGSATHIEKSYKMISKLYRDPDNRVHKTEFVRARMFDLWIGDWSKHEDNWKWAGYKSKNGEIFRPIPRDRDHAFSRWDGIIPWLGDREWAMPNGENFDYKIKGLRSLMWQSRHLDRFLANETTKEQWTTASKEIQSAITSSDIEKAIRQMPPEVYSIDGKEIENKLKARINDLPIYAAQYYTMLAKQVEIVGTHKKECFLIDRKVDGSTDVSVYYLDGKHQRLDSSRLYYSRHFFPNETKEIQLYGLSGDDVFKVIGKSKRSILTRIIPGTGNDIITDSSMIRRGGKNTLIYDKESSTVLKSVSEAKRMTSKDDQFYQYNRAAFKYNTYLPLALLTYNPFTGVAIHGGVTFTRHRFGKPDFSSQHRIRAALSTEGNYELSYGNQFRYAVGKWDAISNAIVSKPLSFNYFFGVGNNTSKDAERDNDYYRSAYTQMLVSAGLLRSFWKQSSVSFISSFEQDDGIDRNNSYLEDNPDILGTEKLNLVFLNALVDLDFRDRKVLPERGFRLLVTEAIGHISKVDESIINIAEVEIENYLSTFSRKPITLGLRVGGGVTDGDLPYYKLLTLGQFNNLQGFRRNRFSGQSRAYINSELRWQFSETHNTLIPLKMGVRAFFDTGRVWADNDDSTANLWHYGYGGGFYVAPFREQFAFNVILSSSKEESLLLAISLGAFFK